MPSSDHTVTRNDIILRSFRRIGIDNPSTNAKANAVGLLNDIVKEIDVEGRLLFTISNTETALNTVISQRTYATGTPPVGLKADILQLENFELLVGTSYISVDIVGKTESLTTYYREGTGQPVKVYLTDAPLLADKVLHLLPTPNAVYACRYTYRRRLYDFTNASDNPDFPQDWNLKLVKRLSAELAPEFGVPIDQILNFHEPVSQKAMKDGKAAAADKAPTVTQRTEYF
jgi:hypothetical protein